MAAPYYIAVPCQNILFLHWEPSIAVQICVIAPYFFVWTDCVVYPWDWLWNNKPMYRLSGNSAVRLMSFVGLIKILQVYTKRFKQNTILTLHVLHQAIFCPSTVCLFIRNENKEIRHCLDCVYFFKSCFSKIPINIPFYPRNNHSQLKIYLWKLLIIH